MITQEIIEFKNKAMTKSLVATKKAIISLTTDIIYDTPVDTGRLRNNWIPSINKGASYSMLGVDTSKAKSKVRPVVAETIGKVSEFKLGDTFYFTNNLPYAKVVEFGLYPKSPKTGTRYEIRDRDNFVTETGFVQLSENGYSKKSPQGMVRKNLLKWSKYFV